MPAKKKVMRKYTRGPTKRGVAVLHPNKCKLYVRTYKHKDGSISKTEPSSWQKHVCNIWTRIRNQARRSGKRKMPTLSNALDLASKCWDKKNHRPKAGSGVTGWGCVKKRPVSPSYN